MAKKPVEKKVAKKKASRTKKDKPLETPEQLTEKAMKEVSGKKPAAKKEEPVEVAIEPSIEDTSEVIVSVAGGQRRKMTMADYKKLKGGKNG